MTDKVRASHILLKNQKAYDIINEQLDNGESFEVLAEAFSMCPSGARGGDLGEFGRGKMVKAFEEAVFALGPGEITQEPVITQFGVHIIMRGA